MEDSDVRADLPEAVLVEDAPPAGAASPAYSSEQIAEILEEDIVFGYLHPRERLVEDDLCARFQATRHAVRRALVELEKMGLIDRPKNVGAFVRAYTDVEVRDLYVVREILETNAARHIRFPVDEAQLAGLTAIQKTHDACAESGNLRGAFRANIAFHQQLFSLTCNPALCAVIDDFARRAHPIRFLAMAEPHFLRKARSDHWAMIRAVQNQDVEGLVALCRDHIIPSRDAYLEQYRQRQRLLKHRE